MDESTQKLRDDMIVLAEEARHLLNATSDVAGAGVVEARKRLHAALDQGSEAYGRVREKAMESARAADQTVREHPYQSIGIALGIGALVGFLISRSK
jgi:ElaB/YqjD/DUF883 family membrane-anchored ribosome-binding protein